MALGVGAERIGGPPQPEATGDLVAGLALLGGGTVAWVRRARGGCAGLMVLTGGAWFAGDLSTALLYAHRGPLVHLLLAYPSGRLRSRATGALVAVAYVDGLVPAIARSTWPTVVSGSRGVAAVARTGRPAASSAARGPWRSPARRIGGALAFARGRAAHGAGADTEALWAYYVAVTVTAIGLTADLLWGRWTRAAVTGLVIDLGDRHEPQALRAALARTLGDPGLQVAYRVAGATDGSMRSGRPVELPAATAPGAASRSCSRRASGCCAGSRSRRARGRRARGVGGGRRAAGRRQRGHAGADRDARCARSMPRADGSSRPATTSAGASARSCTTGVQRRLAAISDRLATLAGHRDGERAMALRRLSAELDDARGDLRGSPPGSIRAR